jgi:hypothetical protein
MGSMALIMRRVASTGVEDVDIADAIDLPLPAAR